MGNHDQPSITWEADLPLFSRRMLSQWSLAMLITAGILACLLTVVFAAQREWDALIPMAGMVSACTGALWLLGLAIMAVVFRGRYRVRYGVSGRGIVCEQIESAALAADRVAIAAGIAARRPGLAGAGLIASARRREEARWSGAFRVAFDSGHTSIVLRNAWRTLMWVQCTPENYADVAAAVESHTRRHGTEERVGRSPLPSYLWRTLTVVVASLPVFALADELETSLFVPIAILCFAAATVWLVNLFGWVVLIGLFAQAALAAARLFEVRRSAWRPGSTYRAYEVLDGGDWSLLVAAALGSAWLAWLSVRALRGRWLAALVQGADDMGG